MAIGKKLVQSTTTATRVGARLQLICAAAPVVSALAGSLFVGSTSAFGDTYWTDANDNWNTTSAWLATQGNALPPGTGNAATPASGPGFVNIGNGGTVTFTGPDVGVQRVQVGYGPGLNFRPDSGAGTLNINAGNIFTAQDMVWGDGAAGTINVNGGNLVFNADSKHFIVGSTGDVTVNLMSGNIDTARYGFENGGGAFSTFNMSGGTFEWKLQSGAVINNAANTINVDQFNFSGGALGGAFGTGGGVTFVTINNISGNGTIAYRRNNSSTELITLDLQNATTWSGVMAGSGSGTATSGDGNLVKQGAALTITSPQQFHRELRPAGGLLTLDYTGHNTGMLSTLCSISLSAGTLILHGDTTNTTETIGGDAARSGLRVTTGGSVLQVDPGASATFTLDTRGGTTSGALSRSVGATALITSSTGTLGANANIIITSAGTNGVLKGLTTNNGTEFATNDLTGGTFGNIVPFSNYSADTDLGNSTAGSTGTMKPAGAQTTIVADTTFNGVNLTGSVGINMTGAGELELASGMLIGNTTGSVTGGSLTVRAPSTTPTQLTPIDLVIQTPQTLTVSSNIVNNADPTNSPVALTKSGSGTLTISGTNTYSDQTYVAGGVLQLGSAGALPATTAVTISNTAGAALDLNGFSGTVVGLSGGGPNGGEVRLNGGATLTIANPSVNTFSGTISGNGNLLKSSAVDFTLNSSGSTYTGATTVTSGVLYVTSLANGGSPSSIGAASTAAANLVLDNGTLRYAGRTVTSTDRLFTIGANGATLSGGGWLTSNIGTFGPLRFTNSGTLAMSGPAGQRTLTLVSGTTAPSNSGGTERGQVYMENLLASVIPDSGAGSPTLVTRNGAGVWYLSGLNTYTGVTTLNTDTLTSGENNILRVNTMADGGQPSSIGAATSDPSNLVLNHNTELQYVGSGSTSNRQFTVTNNGTTTLSAYGTGALVLSSTADISGMSSTTNLVLTGNSTAANTLKMGMPAGSLSKTGPGTWILSGNLAYTGPTQIGNGTFSGGIVRLDTNLLNTSAVTVNTATLQLSANGGTRVIHTGTVNATAGKIDLGDGKLIATSTSAGSWNGSAYTGVTGMVALGRNGNTAPLWDGTNGIVTSQAAATGGNFTSIGVATASDVRPATATATGLWGGQTITGTDTLVMYTYGGDATLDGKINVDDYIKIDSGIAAGLTGWANGDFNYDGKINIDDYTQFIDANIGIQGAQFPTAGGLGGGGASGVTAVPEPASISVIGLTTIAAIGTLRRRRRTDDGAASPMGRRRA